MTSAPLYSEIAEGPPDGAAAWISASDGVRLRVGHWPGPGRGTVFLFPGRCEYIEKYGRTARDLVGRGYGVVAIDWRGQGLSDRLLKNPDIGHVRRFVDYQKDAQAMIGFARARSLPGPWFLLAHSMGGAIALRCLCEGAPFPAAAMSAPMWGIQIGGNLRHVARVVPIFARRLGLGSRQTPTTGPADYFLESPFEGNFLTTSEDSWAYMKRQAAAEPRFRLAGPSLTWLAEALAESRALAKLPKPPIPVHVSLGTEEKIVDPSAIHAITGAWDSADLTIVDGAEHEIMMEKEPLRKAFLDRAEVVFSAFDA